MALTHATRVAAGGPAPFEVASAKVLAGQAARTATRSAHQAHGAIGVTREYPLHRFTRRLWSWRAEYGDETEWSDMLGRLVWEQGPDRLYPLITGGSAATGSA
jgi:acyl-CoA dehydrogenase